MKTYRLISTRLKFYKSIMLLLLLSNSTAFAQQHKHWIKDADNNIPEKTFYIETDTTSPLYNAIADFTMDDATQTEYQQTMKERKTKQVNTYSAYSGNWCSLYLYKGKFYVYKPSDMGNNFRISIQHGLFTAFYMDMPSPQIIVNLKKTKPGQIQFQIMEDEKPGTIFTRTIINDRKKIAVWKEEDPNGNVQYRLMIAADKLRQFPMIVAESNDKVQEFVFDEPPYRLLYGKEKPHQK